MDTSVFIFPIVRLLFLNKIFLINSNRYIKLFIQSDHSFSKVVPFVKKTIVFFLKVCSQNCSFSNKMIAFFKSYFEKSFVQEISAPFGPTQK